MSSLTVSRRPHQTDDWAMVIVHRKAAPPLRFMGRALLCEEAQDMYVRAWEAKAGGVVLAHALREHDGKTGMRHTTAEGAMTALENYCRTLECLEPTPQGRATARPTDIVALLEEAARIADWHRRFRILASKALDRLEMWSARQDSVADAADA